MPRTKRIIIASRDSGALTSGRRNRRINLLTSLLAAACLVAHGCSGEPLSGPVTTIEVPGHDTEEVLSPTYRHIRFYTGVVRDLERDAPYPADIYFPDPAALRENGETLPVVWMVQEGNVDKSYYRQFASRVAGYGYLVVVPNHPAFFGLFAKVLGATDVRDFVRLENETVGSPLAGLIDTGTLLAIGHGFGGAVALQAIEGKCEFPFCCCLRTFERPVELQGAVVYGADLKNINLQNIDRVDGLDFEGGTVPVVINNGIPVAMIRGTQDSLSDPQAVLETFDQIQDPPKVMINVVGANHYSITDVDLPEGAIADHNPSEVDQEVALDAIARCFAIALWAFVSDQPDAMAHLAEVDRDPGGLITVIDMFDE